jgi:hypothetical protein
MRHSYNFSILLLPLILFLILTMTLFIQRTGVTYQVNSQYYQSLQFLPSEVLEIKNFFPDKPTKTLVVYDSQIAYETMLDFHENLYAALDSMRVKYDIYDISSNTKFDYSNYEEIIFATLDTSSIDHLTLDISNWINSGGKIFFAIRPDNSILFNTLLINSDIVTVSEFLVYRSGLEFLSDLLPGTQGRILGTDFIGGASYHVVIDNSSCNVHITSADINKTPIVWVCNIENGRVAVINSDQFGTKVSRGLVGSVYTLLHDTFVYPVINSSTLYIDDFPAPFPEGSNELITKFYNMNTETFFREVWWVDMQEISVKHNIRFTTGMIETYENNLKPPFPKQLELESTKYYGNAILASNGEIIFHGYNHVPLCLSDNDVNESNGYPAWPNTESAQLSLIEVYNFGNLVFDNYSFLGYMPPSNILCSDSRRWLPIVIPDLKYIASIYLPDLDEEEYEQEFVEASDGVIEFPRIISGYALTDDEYSLWAAINELSLHYVSSHFVHPDDMLDIDRHADKGWDNLRDQYDSFLQWLEDAAPGLRNTTGSEGAMAVQRYYRLAVHTEEKENSLEISLGNFYDEAWLILRSTRTPFDVEGGVLTQISSDRYLLQALESKVIISFEE